MASKFTSGGSLERELSQLQPCPDETTGAFSRGMVADFGLTGYPQYGTLRIENHDKEVDSNESNGRG